MTNWRTAFLAGVLAFGLAGCQNEKGADTNLENQAEKASESARDAMEPIGEAAQDVGAATMLTPRLKAAITADKELNDDRNKINVESTGETVTLEGYVYSEALRRKAEQVVREEMQKADARQELVNKLEVKLPEREPS
jgi:osmotically-inducible protein OsmY